MSPKNPSKMTPFDQAVIDDSLLTLKLLLPYLPSEFQPMLGIYTKLTEFRNTISYFSQFHKSTYHASSQKSFHLDDFLADLKCYYPDKNIESIESAIQMMHMMEMIQGFNMEDLMSHINPEDLFQTNKPERNDENGNMDESSSNAEY